VEAAFEAVPPEQVAEIVDGELHVHPRPRPRHSRATVRVTQALGPFDRDHGDPSGWLILLEPELHLGRRPDKLVPNLAAWRRERMPELPDEAALTLAPDWVCEVLSERTKAIDRGKKMRIYRREGVRHVWLVDPVLQTLELYRLSGGQWTFVDAYEGDVRVRVEPFEALEIDLGALWAR
jgi:Uma2 family endonuclease